MEQIINLLIEQATLWAPSLVAVIGVLVGVLKGISNLKAATKEVSNQDALKKIEEQLKTQHADLLREHNDNIALKRTCQNLLDELARVKDYKKEEEENEDETK